jgi:hypothetical protein
MLHETIWEKVGGEGTIVVEKRICFDVLDSCPLAPSSGRQQVGDDGTR